MLLFCNGQEPTSMELSFTYAFVMLCMLMKLKALLQFCMFAIVLLFPISIYRSMLHIILRLRDV